MHKKESITITRTFGDKRFEKLMEKIIEDELNKVRPAAIEER